MTRYLIVEGDNVIAVPKTNCYSLPLKSNDVIRTNLESNEEKERKREVVKRESGRFDQSLSG